MIRIFTDGACSENPGPGGWGAVFNTNEECDVISGHELNTTNNRMELTAVVRALEKIYKDNGCEAPTEFEIHSDSAYVVNGITKGWMDSWNKNGWKTAKGDDVKNRDLWEELIKLREKLKGYTIIRIYKVKGHSGNTFNEYVDKIAKEEVLKAKAELYL